MTLSERIKNRIDYNKPGFMWWDDVYLKKGWWFNKRGYTKAKIWEKHPRNPVNHDCYLNSRMVRLSGMSIGPISIIDDPVEYYYICDICGKRLTQSEYDKRQGSD